MPLWGKGKKRESEIRDFVSKIERAQGREALDGLERELAKLETEYPPGKLEPAYSGLALKFYELNMTEKAYFYATRGKNRDLIVKLLKEEGRSAELEKFVSEWHEPGYYADLLECFYRAGEYEKVLGRYEEYYTGTRDSRILYIAFMSAFRSGDKDSIEKIRDLAVKKLSPTDYHYNLILGRYEELMGNYRGAVQYYEEALKIRESKDIMYELARAYYYAGDIEKAEKMLKRLPQHNVKIRALYSLIYARQGRVNEALGIVDSILSEGDDPDALLAKALIMSEHDIGGYETYLDTVLYRDPYNPVALELYARAHEKTEPDIARKNYEKLLSVNPKNYRALLGLARLSRGEEREKYARQALELNPDCVEAKILVAEFMVDDAPDEVISMLEDVDDTRAHYYVARAYARLEKPEDAERHIRIALEAEPENLRFKFLLARLIADRNREEAEQLIRDVLAGEPDNAEAKLILAEIIYREHPDEALKLLEGQNSYDARWLRVKVYRILNRPEDAKRELKRMLKKGGDVEGYLALAEVSDREDAIEILSGILESNPEHERARIMLAERLVDIDPERAIALVDKLDVPEALKITGLAYFHMENYDAAYEKLAGCLDDLDCKKAFVQCGLKLGKHREILPHARELVAIHEDIESLWLLGEVYESVDSGEAYEIYRKLTLKFPNDVEGWKKLASLAAKTGHTEELGRYYDTLYSLTGDYQYLLEKAKLLERLMRYSELYDTYSQILSEHPELEDIEDKRDALLLKMGRYHDLIQLAEHWISKKGAKAAKGYYLRALAYLNLEKYQDALDNINEAVKRSRSSKYRHLQAEILYRLGRTEDAYKIIESLHTKRPETLLLKAQILRAVGRNEEAETILKELESSGIKEASVELGKLYVDMGRHDEALKYLELAARNFDDPDLYILGARIAYETENYLKSLWFINGGLKKRRNDELLWVYRVLALLNIGEGRDALRAVNHLLTIRDAPEHRLLKARVLNMLGNSKEAGIILKELGDLEFHGISAREELAWAYYAQGEYERSIAIYRAIGNMVMVAKNLYAMRRYRDVLKIEGEAPELLELKGDAAYALKERELAKKQYDAAYKNGSLSAAKKLANLLYEDGELNRAYELYVAVDDSESVLHAARILETLGQYKDAAEQYVKYYERTHEQDIALHAVEIFKKLNMYKEAKELLDGVEDSERVIRARAEIYYHLGDYIRAVESLRNLESEDFEVLALLGDIYYAMGQFQRAREYYQKALALKDDKRVLRSLGRTYEAIGELKNAADAYFRCDDDESFHRAERIYREFKDTEKLRRLYEKRLNMVVDVNAMKNLAEIYMDRGEYVRAYSLYQEVKDYEFSPDVLTRLGMLEIELGRYREAEESLLRALEIEPSSETYHYLGLLYSKMGDYGRARDMYVKSDYPETDRELCRLALFDRNVDEALKYGEAVVKNINDGESWYLYGLALHMAGDYEDALKCLKLAEEKGYGAVKVELGKIYIRMRQYDRALKAVEEDESEDARVLFALAHAVQGEIDEAEEVLKTLSTGDAQKYLGDIYLLKAGGAREKIYYPMSEVNRDALARAIALYRDSLKKQREFSKSGTLYNNLGVSFILQGDIARGTEYLEVSGMDNLNLLAAYLLLKEKSSIPRLLDTIKSDNTRNETYWCLRGVYDAMLKKYDDAMKSFIRAEELVRAPYVKEVITYNRALLLIRLGMYSGALELLATIKLADALLLRTYVYMKLGKFEEGKENLDRYHGDDITGHLGYTKAYLDMKLERYESAIANINGAITRDPENRDYWMLKGIILSRLGKLDAANRAFAVARHMEDREDVCVNMGAVSIMDGHLDMAKRILERVDSATGRFNLGCAFARLGNYDEAERLFAEIYQESKDEKALYYLYLCAIRRGMPPELKEEMGAETTFNLARLLLSSYNVHVVIVPELDGGHLVYKVTVKNLSGDTISPFTVHPTLGTSVTVSKKVGPIRPYEEATVTFKTTKSRAELVREAGIIPGKHVDIKYELYSKGVGIVEEIRVRNLTRYRLSDIVLNPILLEGFEAWETEKKITALEPDAESVVKFALLSSERVKTLRELAETYDEFVPEYFEPEFDTDTFDYKVLLNVHPFEFELDEHKTDYDFETAKSLIKKERRRMLVKNVSKYTEAIVSVER